jgi:hypothetical protein
MTELLLILSFFLIAFYIHTTVKARELANYLVQRACKEQNFQLLDGTVCRVNTQAKLSKKLLFERHYQFEYSMTGDDRNTGYVAISGNRMLNIIYREGNA